MVKKIINAIIAQRREKKVVKAITKANKLAALTSYRYLVLNVGGRIKVFRKKDLKLLIAKRKFKRGVTIQDLEKKAIYSTL